MGAVEVSPFGGLRHRSVFGPAVSVKYSMHWGSVNAGGRFKGVNDEPSGGMLALLYGFFFLFAFFCAVRLVSCFLLLGAFFN